MSRVKLIITILFLCLYLLADSALIYLRKFTFDEDRALDNWSRMVLNGQVYYKLVKYGNRGYLQALSERACSALYHRIGFNLRDYPIVSWKWRVLKFPDISNEKTESEKNDFAARVYIIFPFLNFSFSRFIEYVWAKEIPVGTVLKGSAGDNVKTLVVRSGKEEKGKWVQETRNVYDDFVLVFGRKPNMKAGAIAIMCDADNTQSKAAASFDDIVIASQSGL